MKTSVVVIAYNEEKYLRKCLESLKSQTVAPYEIIVVDNNSTDKTAKIAKEMGARVVEEKKQGASFARNAGFDAAEGDIILRTDADTKVPEFWVERIAKHFEDPKVAIVCGGVVYYRKWLNVLSHFMVFWVDDIFGYRAITGPNFAIRKSVWNQIRDEVHSNDKRFHEDLELAIHAMPRGKYIRDYDLNVSSSPRKLRNISVFFGLYPYKWFQTVFLKEHRKLSTFWWMRLFT